MWGSVRGFLRGRTAVPASDADVARSVDGRLGGALVYVMPKSEEAIRQRAVSLGGTLVGKVEDATHVIVPTGLGMEIAHELRVALLLARRCNVAVVESVWLDAVQALDAEQHWSEASPDSHVPPGMVTLDEAETKRPRLGKRETRRQATEIGASLDETWAYLSKEHPEEAEASELRRAIELSLLDRAVTLRATPRGADAGVAMARVAPSATPEQVLGVQSGATSVEISRAYKRKALEAHPDKGGKPGAFEALLLAYRTLSRTDSTESAMVGIKHDSREERRDERLALQQTVARDEGLRDHRSLVDELFERHGADAASSAKRQADAAVAMGLHHVDLGASNRNEAGELMYNQCFYLSLAAAYLGKEYTDAEPGLGCESGARDYAASLMYETALHLKRVIEAAVLRAHPEWAGSRVGEDVQAFSDFLFYVLDSPTLLSELAIAIFDAESGFVEVYRGAQYLSRSEEEQRSNLLTIRYLPGHYQALVSSTRPSLAEMSNVLDQHSVVYVATDG